MYIPKPENLLSIELPEELIDLQEIIAKNVHDVWAESRIKEGWVLGDRVDSQNKLTPWLIPYEELPESEKEYDRNTAMQTLKLIMKMGYKIEKM